MSPHGASTRNSLFTGFHAGVNAREPIRTGKSQRTIASYGVAPMVHAVRIHQHGGPEVMQWDSVEVPAPGPGQVRLKQHGVGVNYIDVYQRSGLYKMPLPFVAGSEGSGEVVAVGPGVTEFKVG